MGKLAAQAAPQPALSGFRLLASGEEAFGALNALADCAERTLDLQYYLVKSDNSTYALLRRVRAAADRGVRVRLLLDDLNTAGQDKALLALTSHPNIEVRLFNPFPSGRFTTASRVIASLTDFKRINHRMHNKMFVADNALAVTGGRNLGDTYFVRSKESNFLDVDLIVAGPAVRALSHTFDRFWNDPLAYPVTAVASLPASSASEPDPARHPQLSRKPGEPDAPPSANPAIPPFAQEIARGQLRLVWAPSRVLADKPSKVDRDMDMPAPDEAIVDDVDKLIRSAQRELVLISPYFVPGPRGMKTLTDLRKRGVQVRILTNSLATTDAPAVHIGYAKYRTDLIKQGIELHELRTRLKEPRSKLGSFGSSHASLHAKVLVIDGKTSLVGSMNIDPRSERLNTEMGLVVRSPILASQLLQLFQEVRDNSYRLTVDDKGDLHWIFKDEGHTTDLTSEPEASAWLKLMLRLMAPFAPEVML